MRRCVLWAPPRYRIEGIEDSAGRGYVPLAVPGFLFMDIKFGELTERAAELTNPLTY
jgi:hypothetical protein